MRFQYINSTYKVNAEYGRQILFQGKRLGTIISDEGNYIGVNFDDKKPGIIECLHPTWEVKYLGIVKPRKMSSSQARYQRFLNADWFNGNYFDWIKRDMYINKQNNML